MSDYCFPSIELLNDADTSTEIQRKEHAAYLNRLLQEALEGYGLKASVKGYDYNDFSVIFGIKMAHGESAKKVVSMRNDFELRLGCPVEILPGENGQLILAAKNTARPVLPLKRLLVSEAFRNAESKLTVAAGVNLLGNEFLFDLGKIKNQLVIGTTGSGKSTYISDILMSILYKASPRDVRLLMIDPKKVELSAYNGIPHLLAPVIFDPNEALKAFEWALAEAQRRLVAIKKEMCGSLEEYNRKTGNTLAHIVIIVDEFMDLMRESTKTATEDLVRRIVSRTAVTGVHIILSTQRPSRDVVSPKIKALIPCRASFTVADRRESRIAIFRTGAERLLGSGDMIFSERDDDNAVHCQAAYVSSEEVDRVIEHVKTANQDLGFDTDTGLAERFCLRTDDAPEMTDEEI